MSVNVDEFIPILERFTLKLNQLGTLLEDIVVLDKRADKVAEENGKGTPNYDKYYLPYMNFKGSTAILIRNLQRKLDTYTFNCHTYETCDCTCDERIWDSDDERELTSGSEILVCCKCKGIRGYAT